MSNPRAADDFTTIRARMDELRREIAPPFDRRPVEYVRPPVLPAMPRVGDIIMVGGERHIVTEVNPPEYLSKPCPAEDWAGWVNWDAVKRDAPKERQCGRGPNGEFGKCWCFRAGPSGANLTCPATP